MADNKGLPVAGYKDQSDAKVALVNENKILEERCLRQIDAMNKFNMAQEDAGIGRSGQHDTRMMALARTGIQEAFMWLNRAVFQPSRIDLPEDESKG